MPKILSRKPAAAKPVRRAAVKKARKAPATKVEFPQEYETIAPPHYTVRIAAPQEASRVEMSLNGEEWTPCREALGLWWFDWTGFEPGPHLLVARVVDQDGTVLEQVERRVIVV